MAVVLDRINHSTLRGRIAGRIREAILNGSFVEGERLVERKLAAELGSSLTAVREAMIELEVEGFISKKPNSTTHVTKLTLQETEKIFEVRRVLEGFAVVEAARRASDRQVHELETIYFLMEAAATGGDRKGFLEKDYAFHEKMWEITENEYLQSALKRMVVPLFAFTAIRIVSNRAYDLLEDVRSHAPILKAIRARDARAARQALLAGLDEWRREIRTYVFGESREK